MLSNGKTSLEKLTFNEEMLEIFIRYRLRHFKLENLGKLLSIEKDKYSRDGQKNEKRKTERKTRREEKKNLRRRI